MTKKNKDKKLKTPLSQSAVEGFVMPGVFARMTTIQAENICKAYIDEAPTATLYVFKNKEAAKTFCKSRLGPARTKA